MRWKCFVKPEVSAEPEVIIAILKDTTNKWSWRKAQMAGGPCFIWFFEEVILKAPKTLSLTIISA